MKLEQIIEILYENIRADAWGKLYGVEKSAYEILALDEKKEIHIVESHTITGDEANKPTDWSKYNKPENYEDT